MAADGHFVNSVIYHSVLAKVKCIACEHFGDTPIQVKVCYHHYKLSNLNQK